jgi:hypothetical protein
MQRSLFSLSGHLDSRENETLQSDSMIILTCDYIEKRIYSAAKVQGDDGRSPSDP